MREQPSAAALLQAVSGFLRNGAIPHLTGQPAFHARVAANVLDIVARELQQGAAAEAGELERLRALLLADGDPDTLNRELCERIAAGEITLDTPGLAAHLWRSTLDGVAIDQPAYAAYQRIITSEQEA
jgi:hypothetical protein